jgi:hypothetical protein
MACSPGKLKKNFYLTQRNNSVPNQTLVAIRVTQKPNMIILRRSFCNSNPVHQVERLPVIEENNDKEKWNALRYEHVESYFSAMRGAALITAKYSSYCKDPSFHSITF